MSPSTDTAGHRLVVGVSLTQLACGVMGMVLAIRRGHAYDVSFMKGTPQAVTKDSILLGTALSAPVTMLAAQVVLTGIVALRDSRRAARGLGILGGFMTAGYLAERHVRHRLRPDGWDPLETPLVALSMGLAAAMALVGTRYG